MRQKINTIAIVLICTTALLVFTGIVLAFEPNTKDGKDRIEIPRLLKDLGKPLQKIDPLLEKEMRKKREVRVIIMLKDQPSKPFNIRKAKMLAERTQKGLKEALMSMGARDIRSHWIINAISATISSDKVLQLAEREDVWMIWLDQNITIPTPPEKNGSITQESPANSQPDYGDYIINAHELWNLGIYGEGVKIAILDTGIDRTHPMLDDLDDDPNTKDPKEILEKCFTFENKVTDGHGHGTHVAAIAAGTPQNATLPINGGNRTIIDESYLTPVYSELHLILDDYENNDLIRYEYTFTLQMSNGTYYTISGVSDQTFGNIDEYISFDADNDGVKDLFVHMNITVYTSDNDTLLAFLEAYNTSNQTWDILYGYRAVVSGVAPKALLMNGKVLTDFGYGFLSWIISGIEWAVDNDADIISMSLGGWAGDGSGKDPLSMAVENAKNAGKIVVVAAGNAGPGEGTLGTPAVSRGAIAVAASDMYDTIAWFSSRGPTGDGRIGVDIAAPGVDIVSAVPISGAWYSNSFGYAYMSGTSMATPHVSGAIALLLQAYPNLTPDEVEQVLKNSARQIPAFDQYGSQENALVLSQGGGRLDVKAAYDTIASGITVDDEWFVGMVEPGTYTKTFTIKNNGATSVTVTILKTNMYDAQGRDVGDWLTLSSDTLTIPAHGEASFTVTIDIPSYANGTYVGWLNIDGIIVPISVNVIREVSSSAVLTLSGMVDEYWWYDAVYYTVKVDPGVRSLNITFNASDPNSGIEILIFDPNGVPVSFGEWYDGTFYPRIGIPIDNPEPGSWTVLILARWLSTYQVYYNLTINATGSDVLEITDFKAIPENVNQTDILTFEIDIVNKMPYKIYAYAYVEIYQLTVNGREFAERFWLEGTLNPGINIWTKSWDPYRTPGNYEAVVYLYYNDSVNERVCEKSVRFNILSPVKIIVTDANGVEKREFMPGESVYIRATGLMPNTAYKVWIQLDPVVEGELLDPNEDPSGVQELVVTDENGNLPMTLIWTIPSNISVTSVKYDIVLDKQGSTDGTGRFNADDDGINAIETYGIIAPIPEISTVALILTGLILLVGLRRIN